MVKCKCGHAKESHYEYYRSESKGCGVFVQSPVTKKFVPCLCSGFVLMPKK